MNRTPPLAALLLAVAASACERESGPVHPGGHAGHVSFDHSVVESPEVQRWIAGLRAATARYQRFEAARDAGYTHVFMDACFELPGTGGMGYHYVNGGLVDGVVEEFAPEALMYEPQKHGRPRLVGVEFVVPYADWTEADPPSLHGLEFHPTDFGLWTLHVWLWKHNPDGMFRDWNPTVSCRHAQP
jgi:hypothetical protein